MTSTPEERPVPAPVLDQLSEVVGWLSRPGGPVTPTRVVEAAALSLPHGRHAGLTLLRPNRRQRTVAASDDLPPRVDALQHELAEGPCLDAALGPAYARIGYGRNANRDGEACPVFYDTARVELLDWRQLALSNTPAVPGSRSATSSTSRSTSTPR